MKKHIALIVIAAGIVAALLASTVFFRVDELKDLVVLKTFGQVTRVLRGSEDAGLHFKWPWPIQRIVRFDARTRILEGVHQEVSTRDDKLVIVMTYCAWRIADPKKLLTSVETAQQAAEQLRGRLRHYKGTVIGKHDLGALVNTDPNQMRLAEIERKIFEPLRREAMADYGIAVEQVGIQSNSLPESVSKVVIDQQKSERGEYAKAYLASGESQALAIQARARAASDEILAFARRKADDITTTGMSEAAAFYKQFGAAPELAIFLHDIESLKKQLAKNTVFVLDGRTNPAVRYFRESPAAVLKDRRKTPAKPKAGGDGSN